MFVRVCCERHVILEVCLVVAYMYIGSVMNLLNTGPLPDNTTYAVLLLFPSVSARCI